MTDIIIDTFNLSKIYYLKGKNKQIKALDTSKLTMSIIAALRHVEKMGKGEYNRLRDMIDRFEGKVPDHVVQQVHDMSNADAMATFQEAIRKNNE